MKKNSPYAITIIKPDAHRDIIAEIISQDLEKGGLNIVFRKDIALSKEQAEKIYSKDKNKPNFEYAVKGLLGSEQNNFITLLILKSLELEEESALLQIQKIKGKIGEGGIRSKYRISSLQELENAGYAGEE